MLALRFNTNALDEMFNLAGELDSTFRDTAFGRARRSAWVPAIEVHETDEQITLAVELPGVNPQDVNLSVQNGLLSIAGQKNPTFAQDTNGSVRYSERWYGQFERTLALPSGIDQGKIEASYDAGILTIRLHKSEQAKARRIPIGTVGQNIQIGTGK